MTNLNPEIEGGKVEAINPERVAAIKKDWETNPRWEGVKRDWTAENIDKVRGPIDIKYTLAEMGATKLWEEINSDRADYFKIMGAVTGAQATQMVAAGLRGIYVSGWQVAGDANTAGQTYPDQSLYPVDSAPKLVKRINNALIRRSQIDYQGGKIDKDWIVPILADAEAGFGGPLNVFELMKAMIEAGASAVHFEDQSSKDKKCGHMGGKVLVPTSQAITNLKSARLAADTMGTSTIIVARTDADSAKLITSDVDEIDKQFINYEEDRTAEGYYKLSGTGIERAIVRGLAYAPYADMLWCETSVPNIEQARIFAEAIHAEFPDQKLTYNCSPSFSWKDNLTPEEIASFQDELIKLGYRMPFITLAGWHQENHGMWELANAYRENGMGGYVDKLQNKEFASEKNGYTGTEHQKEVGAGYFDEIQFLLGLVHTAALVDSTADQFKK